MLEDAGGAMDKLCAWDHLALLPLSIWKAAFSAEDSTLEEHGFRPLQKVQVLWRQCAYVANGTLLQVVRENSITGSDFGYPFVTSGILLV